jgi:D-alanyl-lipoteichoic acid acyltransferase DltB (MBOAT superfamily)
LPSLFSLAIPAGISFYTIQQAVLVHDAYKRADGIERFLGHGGLLRYTVFVSFFPQLVIGPITYLREFSREIGRPDFGRLRRVDLEVGCTLLVIGLFKKIVMADNLAPYADRAFLMVGEGFTGSSLVALFGALAYFAQLYFDFSGYSDMALGSARLFGVRLPINFLSPLKATGIVDFYRRWHITLTRVVSRFVFTPLSIFAARRLAGRRAGNVFRSVAMLWVPMVLNFLVIALWHGASWTFVLFGLFHGLWYCTEVQITASKRWKATVSRLHPLLRETLGRGLFLFLMMFCFALFRSDSLEHFWSLVSVLFSFQMTGASGFALRGAGAWVSAAFLVILALPNSVQIMRRYRPGYITWRVPGRTPVVLDRLWRPDMGWAAMVTVMAVTCLFFMNRQTPFLYLGF